MTIPVAFVVGLCVLAMAEEIAGGLPGNGSLMALLAWSWLLALPYLTARLIDRSLRRRLARGAGPGAASRASFRLLPGTVPTAYFLLLAEGTWFDLAVQWAGGSEAGRLLLLLLPLLSLELSRYAAEVGLRNRLERAGVPAGAPALRDRAAMLGFVVAPLLCYGGARDLLAADRWLEVFVLGTSVGMTVGLVAFLVFLAVAMPLLFRLLMGTTPRLPGPLAGIARGAALSLGFAPDRVLAMHTRHRMINAAMVGPLPWPRYLVLTDGLLSVLDPSSLRGVIAHEIGHARAGHPAYLSLAFVVVPVLLVHPVEVLGIGEWSTLSVAAVLLLAAVAGVLVLRFVAHRFEYEADVLSAVALGGAAPCIFALRRVGELTEMDTHAGSLRHPSEVRRIGCLLQWEADPAFRVSFDAAGRRLRAGILAATVLGLAAAMWSWSVTWQAEQAVTAFYTGNVAGARQRIALVGNDVPASQWEWWQRFREDVEAAALIEPVGGDWRDLAPRLAAAGWERGMVELHRQGPAAARPWLSLATLGEERSPLRTSLDFYCTAVQAADTRRIEQLRRHLERIAPPELQFITVR